VGDRSHEPEARYAAREAIGLAFVAGLQRLPPRQRAVLVLRDVLGSRAIEVAETLGVTEASVTSALHRARSALDTGQPAEQREGTTLPNSREERELVSRFTDAFEGGDVQGVVALLTEDAWLTMPPEPLEYQGPDAIARFLATVPAGGRLDQFRLVPTRANGQPAFGAYLRDPHTADRARLRLDGADAPRRPRGRDHRLSRHERLPALRAAENASGVGGGMAYDQTLRRSGGREFEERAHAFERAGGKREVGV
jgi:hypothetical protein